VQIMWISWLMVLCMSFALCIPAPSEEKDMLAPEKQAVGTWISETDFRLPAQDKLHASDLQILAQQEKDIESPVLVTRLPNGMHVSLILQQNIT
jgi:hypothetical protein